MITYFPPDSTWIISQYFIDRLNNWTKRWNAELLGWLYTPEHSYYTINLLYPQVGDVTPLMLFQRGNTNPFSFDDELKYKYEKNKYGIEKIICTNKEQFEETCKTYSWIILTIGCDDGDVGWKFKSREEALEWITDLATTNINLTDYWEFLDLYSNNIGYIN